MALVYTLYAYILNGFTGGMLNSLNISIEWLNLIIYV